MPQSLVPAICRTVTVRGVSSPHIGGKPEQALSAPVSSTGSIVPRIALGMRGFFSGGDANHDAKSRAPGAPS